MFKYLFPLLFILLNHCAIAPVIPIAIEDIVQKTENNQKEKITSTKLIEKPYEIDGKWFSEISAASSIASIPRNINNPMVNARKKFNEFFPNFLINGYHKRPIIIGITPINRPIIPKNTNKSRSGSSDGKAASIPLANLVPSSIVTPISYG